MTGYIDAFLNGEGLLNVLLLSSKVKETGLNEWLQRSGTFVAKGPELQPHFDAVAVHRHLGVKPRHVYWYELKEKHPDFTMVHLLLCCMQHNSHARRGPAARKLARILLSRSSGPLDLIGTTRSLAIIRLKDRDFIGRTTREGNEVRVIYGSPWPFIVRHQDNTDSYTLLGDVYFNDMTEADIHEPQSAMAEWCAARQSSFESIMQESAHGAKQQFISGNVHDIPPYDDWICLQ